MSISNIMKTFGGNSYHSPLGRALDSGPFVSTHPTAIRALSRQPDDDVNTRCFKGLHYFLETQGPTGLQTCYARPPRREEPPNLPQLPLFTQNPRPMCRLPPLASLAQAAIGLAANWREESLRDCAIVIVAKQITQK